MDQSTPKLPRIQLLADGEQVLVRANWTQIATTHESLVDPVPLRGRNPSTGAPILMKPAPDERAFNVGGKTVGHFVWSTYSNQGAGWQDEHGVVLVTWDREYETDVRELAKQFATELNAEFVVD